MESLPAKVRKLRPIEIFLEVSQNEFSFNVPCYWMLLESKEKVTEKQIEETLRILYRNIDILQLCVRKENGEYWFCEMDEERILLKVRNNQSPYEIFDSETHTNFDSATGPLWRATFIPSHESLKENNFYTSNIMLTFNHAIVDGFTSLTICSSFLKVLNDVIGGKVEETYNFGEFNDGLETEELATQKIENLK
ncbi:hypothetical protein Anas_14451 [Armadillidium nasatum]|uniref:Condensation domain-containing protein n=1 Tax=Armadillidium nasatum TaxID=96803 RepID=A0A5N5T3D1_9CRUS|nr:hypothetical protein Anas_14451 [Armadillidium nasatum]